MKKKPILSAIFLSYSSCSFAENTCNTSSDPLISASNSIHVCMYVSLCVCFRADILHKKTNKNVQCSLDIWNKNKQCQENVDTFYCCLSSTRKRNTFKQIQIWKPTPPHFVSKHNVRELNKLRNQHRKRWQRWEMVMWG